MLSSSLADVLKIAVETVNFVRGRALNHRIFMQLCKEMNSKFKVLLYHTEVQWLSRGKKMNRVFTLRAELLEFLKSHNHRLSKHFEDSSFVLTLAFLSDIFGALNQLSCQMQGGGKNVIEAEKKTSAFQRKLKLCRQRLENHNFANFPLLNEVVSDSSAISDEVSCNELQGLLPVFAEHLQKLQRSFENYFPEQYSAWARQSFCYETVATTSLITAIKNHKQKIPMQSTFIYESQQSPLGS